MCDSPQRIIAWVSRRVSSAAATPPRLRCPSGWRSWPARRRQPPRRTAAPPHPARAKALARSARKMAQSPGPVLRGSPRRALRRRPLTIRCVWGRVWKAVSRGRGWGCAVQYVEGTTFQPRRGLQAPGGVGPGDREVLEWPYTAGGGGVPPWTPPPPQSDHSGNKRNLQEGKSCRAICGTQTFGSHPPFPLPLPLPPTATMP